ncbi:hypothetical protein E3N88_45796 [Mikania micrantha]|nr:hypothetical protein E3N88_45796 [Mikania micrantha]
MQSSAHPLSASDLYCHSQFYIRRANENGRTDARFADLGDLQHAPAFHHEDAVDLSTSSLYSDLQAGNAAVFSNSLQSRQHHMNFVSSIDMSSIDHTTGQLMMQQQKAMVADGGGMGKGHFDNWGESATADNSQQTDSSTDIDTDDKNQLNSVHNGAQVSSMGKIGDQKVLRRLAQNREAARKSRLRKKAYVQQLENSRLKLTQLEQELKRAQQQGMFVGGGVSGDQSNLVAGNGALAFDMDYARWLDDHQRLINDVRSAVNAHVPDNELRLLVEAVMLHYDEIFRLKSIAAKSDVFHMLSGMWKSPAERCFMWIGGFRSSELLKILGNHLEPLTDQQLMGICNLQQSSQQAEDALSQGMEALQQSLVDTLSVGFTSSGNVADYMGQMAIAMSKLTTLENFLHQADLLRQQTLQQLHRILTTRQAARALLVISDYTSRLRALSSLWLARPKD